VLGWLELGFRVLCQELARALAGLGQVVASLAQVLAGWARVVASLAQMVAGWARAVAWLGRGVALEIASCWWNHHLVLVQAAPRQLSCHHLVPLQLMCR
jgi:hypothetical protein